MISAINGLIVGLLIALIIVIGGWVGLLLAIVLGGAGFLVAGHLTGELNLKALRGPRA